MENYGENRGDFHFLRMIVSILLVLGMTASLLGGLASANIRIATSDAGVRKIVEQALAVGTAQEKTMHNPSAADSILMDWVQAASRKTEEPLQAVPLGWDFSGLQEGIEKIVYEVILKVIQSQMDQGLAMDPRLLWDFYSRTPSQQFLREKMVALVQDMVNGEHTETVTVDEVRMLIEENTPLLEESFGFAFTPLHVTICVKLVEHSGALEILEEEGLLGLLRWIAEADSKNGAQKLQKIAAAEQGLQQLRDFRKTSNILLAAAIFAVLLVLLLLLNRLQPGPVLTGTGVSLSLGGLAFLAPMLAGLLSHPVLLAFSKNYLDGALNLGGMQALVKVLLPLNLTVTVAGVVILLIGAVRLNGGRPKPQEPACP